MKKVIKTILKLCLGMTVFIVSLEAGLLIKESLGYKKHILVPKDPVNDNQDDSLMSVLFTGDSFAKTSYVKDGYPEIFREYFNSKQMNFLDFSKDGSGIKQHKSAFDNMDSSNVKLVLYFYNISDIITLKDNLASSPEKNEKEVKKTLIPDLKSSQTKKSITSNQKPKKKKFDLKAEIRDLKSIELIRDVLHQLFVLVTDNPIPGSNLHAYNDMHRTENKRLVDYLNSIQSEKVVVVVNYPFNFGSDKTKRWDVYSFFQEIKLNSNVHVIQVNDVDLDNNAGVSWRNTHPNQNSIKVISNHVINYIAENNLLE